MTSYKIEHGFEWIHAANANSDGFWQMQFEKEIDVDDQYIIVDFTRFERDSINLNFVSRFFPSNNIHIHYVDTWFNNNKAGSITHLFEN